MARLESVSLTELRDQLETFGERRPMLRLLAAILYKQGQSAPTIADWFDVRVATVYAWFDRIESEPSLEGAIRDDPRPGRPPRLSRADRRRFHERLRRPPSEAGFDADEWTPRLAQTALRAEFDVEYSLRHVRRLLRPADGHDGASR